VVILDLNDGVNQASNAIKQPILLFQNSKTDSVWTVLDDDFCKTFYPDPHSTPVKVFVCGLL